MVETRYWDSYDAASPPSRTSASHVRFVVISDTHSEEMNDVPDGDVLLHSGDLTKLGSDAEVRKQIDWLVSLPHPHKVIIAGNHDFALDNSTGFYDRRGVKIHAKYGYPRSDTTAALRYVRGKKEHGRGTLHYLENEGVEIEVKGTMWKCWGSPATPVFGHWAWNYERGEEAKCTDIDIFLTHGPPHALGGLDKIHNGVSVGCEELARLAHEGHLRPALWACGHIHEARGVHEQQWPATEGNGEGGSTLIVNSAMVEFDLKAADGDHAEDSELTVAPRRG
ncbi:Metallo-dependent phosphatase [Jaminaea rosea]|uniref:Metallo-dependent phosphatase n=1 Tax=Jaminaea rosea TaxID=1569628 RepID=A0A316UGU7_9BASI|nr:Metallo-dependent phosphatase [Jaminaea rosea]PWN24547.1 Metallo-dependent phosphatase [Jaminaea rosea]